MKFLAIMVGLSSVAAQADYLISKNLNRAEDGAAEYLVNQLLGVRANQEGIHKLFIIASSKNGQGQLKVLVNNQLLETARLPQELESIQVDLDRSNLGQVRRITLNLQGNTQVAMIGLSVDEIPEAPPANLFYSVNAVIENSYPFNVHGRTIEAIEDSCKESIQAIRETSIDDLAINGTSMHKAVGYWNKTNVCAIIALNARSNMHRPATVIKIEDTTFQIERRFGNGEARVVAQIMPRALSGNSIDDITIDGIRYHKTLGYWNSLQASAIIANALMEPTAGDYLESVGNIEGIAPFRFFGGSNDEIQSACATLIQDLNGGLGSVDDLTVNGKRFYKSAGYYNAAEICMIIANAARVRP